MTMFIISQCLWVRNSGMAQVGPLLQGLFSGSNESVSATASGISGHEWGGASSKPPHMVVGRIQFLTGC